LPLRRQRLSPDSSSPPMPLRRFSFLRPLSLSSRLICFFGADATHFRLLLFMLSALSAADFHASSRHADYVFHFRAIDDVSSPIDIFRCCRHATIVFH